MKTVKSVVQDFRRDIESQEMASIVVQGRTCNVPLRIQLSRVLFAECTKHFKNHDLSDI